ncbi:hypothetical protein CLOM_g8703 [Closterium sp. NIES-68]|nr:hypothetical protein CLOM_g21193 [Closterium sp. NIES-68]GJP59643.1 hypothetical protein CLOP_g13783 [Closterium sp. NIES-67]GJP36721.1 hypothetical protein CLOM_g21196 [Closterium sp. NIES-68]GJP39720.1 hypothetical protein CLOM_g24062 [Closterium sp. NIES-68]GJP49504.1 hypothetical protein CLOM_g8703 [Closterium sp. NIES-68]
MGWLGGNAGFCAGCFSGLSVRPRSVALGRETQPTHISLWRLRKPVSLATRIRERHRLLKLEASVWHVKVPYP